MKQRPSIKARECGQGVNKAVSGLGLNFPSASARDSAISLRENQDDSRTRNTFSVYLKATTTRVTNE
jgi:hypothetical protein